MLAKRLAPWLVLLLAGCATYRSLPLPTQIQPLTAFDQLRGSRDVATPLRMVDVDRLVLLNAPDLCSARAQHQLAQAQMLQAGLLPNPSFNGSAGFLLSGVGNATAWSADLGMDVGALLTFKAHHEVAKATAQQVDASLLWQEWQTLAEARRHYVDIVQGEQLVQRLRDNLVLLEQRDAHLKQSLRDGDGELIALSPLFAATADAQSALNDAERNMQASRHALNAMLGLAQEVPLSLAAAVELSPVDISQVRTDVATLERRRPDLVALQLGYQAQEARVRAAVLTQFPLLSLGYQATQDNSRVRNAGPAATLELPIFDHHQHAIADVRATREQLRSEYIARVTTAKNEVTALLLDYTQTTRQQQELVPRLVAADRAAAAAERAFTERAIDQRSYVELDGAALTRHVAAITLEQHRLQQQIALSALLGAGMPITLSEDIIQP